MLAFVQPRQLSALARKIVRGNQLIESLLRSFEFMQSEGSVNPTLRVFWR